MEIYCINLISRQDRYENMKNIFKQLDILDQIKFHIVTKSINDGMHGCFESHYEILNDSKADIIII